MSTKSRFVIFEGADPEEIDRDLNGWLAEGNYIVEGHSSFSRQDYFDKKRVNIVVVIQYRLKEVRVVEGN